MTGAILPLPKWTSYVMVLVLPSS